MSGEKIAEENLDVLGDEQTVDQPKSRLLPVIGAVLLLGVLIAAAVVLIVILLSSVKSEGPTVERLSTDTGIELPADATVVSANYEVTSDEIVVDAELALQDDSVNPFEGTFYIESANSTHDWPEDLVTPRYYVASGEDGALTSEAVYAYDQEGNPVVLVHLVQKKD